MDSNFRQSAEESEEDLDEAVATPNADYPGRKVGHWPVRLELTHLEKREGKKGRG